MINKMFAMSLVAFLAGCATTSTDLPTQAQVDLTQYVGTWYEQARLPTRFQQDCVGEVSAEYVLNADNTLGVTNRCQTADDGIKVATGEGRLAKHGEERDPARLEVRFAPKWTSWLPMVWGDYWIIRVDENYQYSLVGTPDRKYLWVLSRDQIANQATVDELLDYAGTLEFPIEEIIRTKR